MSNIHIPVVIGTSRAGRQSDKVATAVVELINTREDASAELVDVKDHVSDAITTPPWGTGGADEHTTAWKEIVEKSQALILVIPEYNHGYPGELKLLLDSLWEHYKGMPVALVGVSAGSLGGARVIDHIKPVLIEMYLEPIRESVTFSRVKDAFNEDGSLKDQKTAEYIQKMVTGLVEKCNSD
tara:strand:+ start:316 stop:864 length:549 start_codon:yes stop_codon:yes gene_type:complete